ISQSLPDCLYQRIFAVANRDRFHRHASRLRNVLKKESHGFCWGDIEFFQHGISLVFEFVIQTDVKRSHYASRRIECVMQFSITFALHRILDNASQNRLKLSIATALNSAKSPQLHSRDIARSRRKVTKISYIAIASSYSLLLMVSRKMTCAVSSPHCTPCGARTV